MNYIVHKSRDVTPFVTSADFILDRNMADLDYCADIRSRFAGVTDNDLNDDWLILDEIAGAIATLADLIAAAHRRANFMDAGPPKSLLIELLCDIADDAFDPSAACLIRAQARLDGCD